MRHVPLLDGPPYISYAYAYPHKTAYRGLRPSLALADLWSSEDQSGLFLYIHVPFCHARCGYCNLFTTAGSSPDVRAAYAAAVRRQARAIHDIMPTATFARMAIGGGTPTVCSESTLGFLFDIAEHDLATDLQTLPISVEASPATATTSKLRLLKARGVDRISIGIQSFVPEELAAAGRRHNVAEIERALDRIRQVGFHTLNMDLIYGLPGQTVESWLRSIRAALRFAPEELYLYPLYVRPLTSLGESDHEWNDTRLNCYRAGRDLLLERGYTQLSMRMFRAEEHATAAGPAYRCQEDGMVGLGCGARSYTRTCHYSSRYAVGRSNVRAILEEYINHNRATFGHAYHGFLLNHEEACRRYVIKSLLRVDGLSIAAYQDYLGSAPFDDLPQLQELLDQGLATLHDDQLRLSTHGLERSDVIGPWLYSPRVQHLIDAYVTR